MRVELFVAVLNCTLWLGVAAAAARDADLSLETDAGAFLQAAAPVGFAVKLTEKQIAAAREGRLGLVTIPRQSRGEDVVPVQWEGGEPGAESRATFLLPSDATGRSQFQWRETEAPFLPVMCAATDTASGQIEISEEGKPVLRYNYQTVEPGDLLDRVSAKERIHARARSDYIHPLYGLNGEVLTRDWPLEHPHHRGIYWAWPEVDSGGKRGDLHALQNVFARPTGKVKIQSGPVFAQIEAENHWLWEDREPIVRELAVIRAYRAMAQGRMIDLTLQFVALRDGVTIARRATDRYGGLNVRLATPQTQSISVFTDPPGKVPRRAWSDLSGHFTEGEVPSGLTILQHPANPNYPGDWVKYPDLSWCQPAFPASGTRYALRRREPLLLRFRLWVHAGATPGDDYLARLWDSFCSPGAAEPVFEKFPGDL